MLQSMFISHKILFVLVFLGLWYFCLTPLNVLAATLSLSPDTGVYTVGEFATVRVLVNTQGQTINAADGRIRISGSGVSIASVSQAGSIFSLWAEEPRIEGTDIVFSGGIPAGYTGAGGTVMTFTLRFSSAGTARAAFQDGSVLAADGRGSNVLANMNGGTYTIRAIESAPEPERIQFVPVANTPRAPQITSSTHTDQDGWSTNTRAELSWNVPSGVTQVRTAVTQSAQTIPNQVADTLISSFVADSLPNGVSYVHVQFRNAEGWGEIARYRLAVDTQAPQGVLVQRNEAIPTYLPEQELLVTVASSTAPVTAAIVQIGGAEPIRFELASASSTITLPALEPGYYPMTIEVRNAAGLSTIKSLALEIDALAAPVVDALPDRFIADAIPVFTGTTRPNAQVTGVIRSVANDERNEYEVISDSDGRFRIIPDRPLRAGIYELSVSVIDNDGARSESSQPIRFIVQEPGYIQFGAFMISVLSITVPAVALFVVLVLLLWYGWYRWNRLRRRVARESLEAHEMLRLEFAELSRVLAEEEAALLASRKNGQLTKAEEALLDRLRAQLKTAHQRVAKEIADVEGLVPSAVAEAGKKGRTNDQS